jgi:hypothetical protein
MYFPEIEAFGRYLNPCLEPGIAFIMALRLSSGILSPSRQSLRGNRPLHRSCIFGEDVRPFTIARSCRCGHFSPSNLRYVFMGAPWGAPFARFDCFSG